MNKKHIAVDLDDVVLDFVGGLRTAVKTEYGVDIPEGDINKWDLHPFLDPVIGGDWWEWLRSRDWLWPNFPAMDGAIGNLTKLRREGYYLECVTSKPRWAEFATWKWMGKWRPPFQRVTIVHRESKASMTDAYIMIDDKPENLDGFLRSRRHGILFGRAHNASNDEYDYRANNWAEVYEFVHKLSGEPIE